MPDRAPVLIRPAAAGDRPDCARIYLEARRAAFGWLDGAALRLGEFERSVEGERIWVAGPGGRVAGFASFWQPATFLHNLFVAPAAQGRGIGTALLDHVVAQAATCGRGRVRLKCDAANRPALEFYRRRGWIVETEGVQDGRLYLQMLGPAAEAGDRRLRIASSRVSPATPWP